MSERPTPQTNAKASPHIGFYSCATVPANFARALEQERDEAREAFVIATDQMVIAQGKVREANKERDEAREDLEHITQYGTEEINAAVVLRQKLAQALIERDEAITRRMETIMQCELYEQERDEAIRQRDETNESSVFSCNFYYEEKLKAERERDEAMELLASEKITRNHIIKRSVEVERERDEAREKAERYRIEANAMMMQRDETREALRSVLELAEDIPDEALDDWKNYFHTILEAAK